MFTLKLHDPAFWHFSDHLSRVSGLTSFYGTPCIKIHDDDDDDSRDAGRGPVEPVLPDVVEHGVISEVLGALAAPDQPPDDGGADLVGYVVSY